VRQLTRAGCKKVFRETAIHQPTADAQPVHISQPTKKIAVHKSEDRMKTAIGTPVEPTKSAPPIRLRTAAERSIQPVIGTAVEPVASSSMADVAVNVPDQCINSGTPTTMYNHPIT
jgi:hypothetical protein